MDKGKVMFPQVSRSVSFADFDDRFLMEFETRDEGMSVSKHIRNA
jgi:hypothetical protein